MVYSRDLLVNSDNELWIGAESGVYIYNLRTDKYVHLHSSKDDPYSLSDNAVYSLCEDRESGIWVGSYFGGVDYYPKSYTYLRSIIRKMGTIICKANGSVSFVRIIRAYYGLAPKMVV